MNINQLEVEDWWSKRLMKLKINEVENKNQETTRARNW